MNHPIKAIPAVTIKYSSEPAPAWLTCIHIQHLAILLQSWFNALFCNPTHLWQVSKKSFASYVETTHMHFIAFISVHKLKWSCKQSWFFCACWAEILKMHFEPKVLCKSLRPLPACCLSKVLMNVHVYFSAFLLRRKKKMHEICTQNVKNPLFTEQNSFFRQNSIFGVTSFGTKHNLKLFEKSWSH